MSTSEPLTLPNALDVLRSWSWLYDGLKRSDWDGTDEQTDRHIAEGVAKGRNRQCSRMLRYLYPSLENDLLEAIADGMAGKEVENLVPAEDPQL